MIFVLALAGRFAAAAAGCPPGAGTLPTHRPLFVVLLSGVALVVVGLTYVPGARPRPDRGVPVVSTSHAWIATALPGAVRKLDPRELVAHPGDAGRRDRRRRDHRDVGPRPEHAWAGCVTVWLWLTVLFGTLAESVAEGRGKAQAASLRALQQETTARRRARRADARLSSDGRRRAAPPARRRRRGRRGRRADPRRRRRHRGRRLGRRVGGHRRVRAGDPRVRRRPLRGHRRHRRCSPTGSSSGSPPTPASRSWTG